MDGENNGFSPINPWMIWGENPHYFRKHPYSSVTSSTAAVTRRQDRELEHFRERQHEELELERRRHGGGAVDGDNRMVFI